MTQYKHDLICVLVNNPKVMRKALETVWRRVTDRIFKLSQIFFFSFLTVVKL